jgi:site-specific DNA-cytosine methylase
MNYLSVCSGIEAASVAWHPLGWRPFAFSEIEKFPSRVLLHHYPDTPNFGDMTKFQEWPDATINVLVGGTPCQSFSVAGLRAGLDDPRGNLMLTYLAIAGKYRPEWLVWENVPGVLSSNGGRDFGALLGGLAKLGYGFSYRILDAKHFGVPQRRRRVFVVGCLGDWRRAAAVLFERQSLSGISEEACNDSVKDGAWWAGEGRVLNCIDASYGRKWGSNQWYARGHVIVDRDGRPRRASVLEVERCFGFPDNYTAIPGATEDPRYKALGNSMAVPVMRWIGTRIAMVDAIGKAQELAV